ncbi:peptide deformylase [Alicyclobacillus cycloheptanicus]|uniref:Peptide deformylase n=1 Tax=Alicyclobacillus cycloheptanicus TaxID=1457 RepID=A0ABT9XLR2_9BACL|nr:peptide deformylase [Alicyclobacillus cycloheptanicus]MDQ0191220.1 peptide deformylase [Alicyclobacillus cycloheptanicus]WDM01541.1 peptide deformylase [Alicyclobacillus cycloheptanicus]
MSVQPILQGDIPPLRQRSDDVTTFDHHLHRLLADLTDTLAAYRGVGLSAPQIGVHQRVMVVDIGSGVMEFINPQITDAVGCVEGYESCLSFPDHTLKIARPEHFTVKALDRCGQPFQLEAAGFLARVICHEVDHLDGVLFMDYLSEEELFIQLLENASLIEDADDDPADAREEEEELEAEASAPDDLLQERLVQAEQEELQMALDMLSEAAWKLTLSAEILHDYQAALNGVIDWAALDEMMQALDSVVDAITTQVQTEP